MDEVVVQCPYCSEQVVIFVEPDVEGRFVQDCEVCCRPWDVYVLREGDGPPRVTVERT